MTTTCSRKHPIWILARPFN